MYSMIISYFNLICLNHSVLAKARLNNSLNNYMSLNQAHKHKISITIDSPAKLSPKRRELPSSTTTHICPV
jgi:hypothetical protein